MFEGFKAGAADVGATTIFHRRGGQGAPLLLLHGFPETHLIWRDVAPLLARDFTVVCADLRGYGASGKPASTPDHAPYAKGPMGEDMVRLMTALGFDRFCVAGHDRGGRVAYRMALDHPDRIARLAVLDIVPTGEVMRRADIRAALSFWPYWLLSQPAPLPERLLTAAPEAVVDDAASQWGSAPGAFPPEVRAAYAEALGDPATAHAICEEYRAAATLDFARDEADRAAGRKLACPVLALWARDTALDRWYADEGGPLGLWRSWADQVEGRAVDGGHFFPEEIPAETARALAAFFRHEASAGL